MRNFKTVFTMMALAAMLVFSGSAFAAKGGDPGPPDDGGGAPDYGDLIILYRDINGVPYPSDPVEVEDPDGELVDGGLCWQPIAFNVSDEPDTVCPTSCVVDSFPAGRDVVDVDQYSCGVVSGCSGCTQEVDFGRINEARSPAEVFDSQLEDVVVSLSTADQVTLDPAGRLVASTCDSELDNLAKAIDSPLQNLAIYRQLMLTGFIGTAPGIDLPDDNFYNTAARGLGAASDKSGGVNWDLVAYLNQIMGLSDRTTPTVLGKLCEWYREEVQGEMQDVEKCFLNYGSDPSDIGPAGADYAYTREDNFSTTEDSLPFPAYIPDDTAFGSFEYLAYVPNSSPPLFQIMQGPITSAVFDDEPGYTDGNIGGFAQASEDTRAVISFMHENQVPVDFETAVPCVPSGEIHYDLSISEQSGLQVPKNYVNGGEREFFVNVANLGPDTANGTVTVEATVNGDYTIVCDDADAVCTWTLLIEELPAGQTDSFTVYFTITTDSDTINWTAAVEADPPGTDPNPGNNNVDSASSVRSAGGGGGH